MDEPPGELIGEPAVSKERGVGRIQLRWAVFARPKSKKRRSLSGNQVPRWSSPFCLLKTINSSDNWAEYSNLLGRRSSGHPSAEKAAAQESAFQRAVAVNAAAAEARHLACRIQARHHPPPGREPARSRSVSRPPSDLRVRTFIRTAIRGPSNRATTGAGFATRVRRSLRMARPEDQRQLGILAGHVPGLDVAGLDLPGAAVLVHNGVADQIVHAADQFGEVLPHHEVSPMVHERLHRGLHAAAHPARVRRRSRSVRSGFCSLPDRANSS